MGGRERGRKLKGPPGKMFRPSTGRVKEFIFSYLHDTVLDADFLDLFSGTGSIGIEALSRGASRGTFVEKSRAALPLLDKNLKLCHYTDISRIIKGDVFTVMAMLGRKNEKFDLIFADPPFREMYTSRIVDGVEGHKLLEPSGLLIIEHDKKDTDCEPGMLSVKRSRQFGRCLITVYGY